MWEIVMMNLIFHHKVHESEGMFLVHVQFMEFKTVYKKRR